MGGSGRGKSAGRAAAVALLGFAVACGARAMVDPTGEQEETGSPPRTGGGAGGSNGSSGNGAGPRLDPAPQGTIDLGGTRLPDCKPGFSPSNAGTRECAFTFRGQCYEEWLDACACACTGPGATQCIIGGFLNPDEPQTVSCIAR